MLSDYTKDLHSVSERFRNFQKLQDSSFHGVMRRWRGDEGGGGDGVDSGAMGKRFGQT